MGSAFSLLPWRVLLIPGGGPGSDYVNDFYASESTDDLLTSGKFVESLFDSNPEYSGLIFHLSDTVNKVTYLDSIYPALKVAFASASEWPGVVLWNVQTDESAFFAVAEGNNEAAKAEVQSIIRVLL